MSHIHSIWDPRHSASLGGQCGPPSAASFSDHCEVRVKPTTLACPPVTPRAAIPEIPAGFRSGIASFFDRGAPPPSHNTKACRLLRLQALFRDCAERCRKLTQSGHSALASVHKARTSVSVAAESSCGDNVRNLCSCEHFGLPGRACHESLPRVLDAHGNRATSGFGQRRCVRPAWHSKTTGLLRGQGQHGGSRQHQILRGSPVGRRGGGQPIYPCIPDLRRVGDCPKLAGPIQWTKTPRTESRSERGGPGMWIGPAGLTPGFGG